MTEQEKQEKRYSEALTVEAAATAALTATRQRQHDQAWDELVKMISTIYQNNWSFEDFNKFARSEKLSKKMVGIVNDLYKQHKTITRDILEAEYLDKTAVQIKILNAKGDLIPITKVFNAEAAINQPNGGVYWFDRLGKSRNDTLYRLGNIINSGLYNGVSYAEMTKNLQAAFGDDLITNNTIARTEAKRVTSVAQTDVCDTVADAVGLVKTWKTMQDERVRRGGTTKKGKSKANHVKMNGVTIPYDEDFVTPSGSRGKAPHQMKGPKSASDNCNCRCIMLVRVVENSGLNGADGGIIDTDIQIFAEKDIVNQSSSSLKKAMQKYEKHIAEHQDKIANPQKHILDWDSKDVREQSGLIKHWKKEVDNFNQSITDRNDELKKRGDYDD